jgi:hypothetical protein
MADSSTWPSSSGLRRRFTAPALRFDTPTSDAVVETLPRAAAETIPVRRREPRGRGGAKSVRYPSLNLGEFSHKE